MTMTDPHEHAPDENPEDHIGEELADPWDEDEPNVIDEVSSWRG